jgi:8-oxo-dGTP pyrophosphatase MutT (NUDIX family)
LGCHPTGEPAGVYDLSKGQVDEGEDFAGAAVRELREETGISLSPGDLTYLGRFPLRNGEIELFYVAMPVEVSSLHCDSLIDNPHTPDRIGLPEMDGYVLIHRNDRRGYKWMGAIERLIRAAAPKFPRLKGRVSSSAGERQSYIVIFRKKDGELGWVSCVAGSVTEARKVGREHGFVQMVLTRQGVDEAVFDFVRKIRHSSNGVSSSVGSSIEGGFSVGRGSASGQYSVVDNETGEVVSYQDSFEDAEEYAREANSSKPLRFPLSAIFRGYTQAKDYGYRGSVKKWMQEMGVEVASSAVPAGRTGVFSYIRRITKLEVGSWFNWFKNLENLEGNSVPEVLDRFNASQDNVFLKYAGKFSVGRTEFGIGGASSKNGRISVQVFYGFLEAIRKDFDGVVSALVGHINHEFVHAEHFRRSGGKSEEGYLEPSEAHSWVEYATQPEEIQSWARSVVEYFIGDGYPLDVILDILSGSRNSPIGSYSRNPFLDQIRDGFLKGKVSAKAYHKFLLECYNYVQQVKEDGDVPFSVPEWDIYWESVGKEPPLRHVVKSSRQLLVSTAVPATERSLREYGEGDEGFKRLINTPLKDLPRYRFLLADEDFKQFENGTLAFLIYHTIKDGSGFKSFFSVYGGKVAGFYAYQEISNTIPRTITHIKAFSLMGEEGFNRALAKDLYELVSTNVMEYSIEWWAAPGNPANEYYNRILWWYGQDEAKIETNEDGSRNFHYLIPAGSSKVRGGHRQGDKQYFTGEFGDKVPSEDISFVAPGMRQIPNIVDEKKEPERSLRPSEVGDGYWEGELIDSATARELLEGNDNPDFYHRAEHLEATKAQGRSEIIRCYASTLELRTKSEHFDKNKTYYRQWVLFKDFKVVARDKKIPFEDAVDFSLNFGDVHIRCSCFTGDTKVRLLDGRDLSFNEIGSEFGTGVLFWVLASDVCGNPVPTKARFLGEVDKVNKLALVTLDNGEVIRCTLNHLFRLRDGSYKMAEYLRVGESLMPLYLKHYYPYRGISGRNAKYTGAGYFKVKQNSSGRWVDLHRLVLEHVSPGSMWKKRIETQDFASVHHINFNGLDNTPENLVWMGRSEHLKYHGECANRGLEYFKETAKAIKECPALNYIFHSLGGKVFAKNHPELLQKFVMAGVAWNKDPRNKSEKSEIVKKSHADGKYAGAVVKLKEFHSTPESRKMSSKYFKSYWDSDEGLLHKERLRKSRVSSGLLGGRNPMESFDNRQMLRVGKVLSYCFKLVSSGVVLSDGSYEAFRVSHCKTTPRWSTVFSSWEAVLRAFQSAQDVSFDGKFRGVRVEDKPLILKDCVGYNHKVVSVDFEDVDNVSVFCLEVPEYENFALSSGIFVHNCPSHKFHGYAYMGTQLQYLYGLPRENRFPKIRNPNLQLTTCKHVHMALEEILGSKEKIIKMFSEYYKRLPSVPEDTMIAIPAPKAGGSEPAELEVTETDFEETGDVDVVLPEKGMGEQGIEPEVISTEDPTSPGTVYVDTKLAEEKLPEDQRVKYAGDDGGGSGDKVGDDYGYSVPVETLSDEEVEALMDEIDEASVSPKSDDERFSTEWAWQSLGGFNGRQ